MATNGDSGSHPPVTAGGASPLQIPSAATQRITPRNSIAESPSETPYATLVQLAAVVNKTPDQVSRPIPPRPSGRRTPGAGRLNPRVAKSPHLNRAFELRATPGRDRRKSRSHIAESPRDWLRLLSRQLATTSAPPEPTPRPSKPRTPATSRRGSDVVFYRDPSGTGQGSDDDTLQPPRLSTNLNDFGQDDDDSFEMRPPRLSLMYDDADLTTNSIEIPRRARPEYESRASLGLRMSGFGVGDVTIDEGTPRTVNGGDFSPVGDLFLPEDEGLDILGDEEEDESFSLPLPDVDMNGELPLPDFDETTQFNLPVPTAQKSKGIKKPKKSPQRSRYGLEFQSLPPAVIKKLVACVSNSKVSKEGWNAIKKASDQYFEQVSDDLRAYAEHAGRKTIDESDAMTLLQRQRILSAQTTALSLGQKYLPRELAQEIRMPVTGSKRRKG